MEETSKRILFLSVMREHEPGIHIRRARGDDAASIAAVMHAAFVEYEAAYTLAAFAATTPTPEQIQRRMSEGAMWVALKDGTIVGTVSVVAKSQGLYVRGMAVLPSAQGQRIGPLLLEHVKQFASRERCERLFLSTTPFLTHAIRLYEQWGFRRGDEGPHELFGTPLFTMVKMLSTPTESDGVLG
jgi:GNAT superfamily N-acetyltransferase